MWLLIAVVMGIVEGLTEFVPVSSTGHLIVTGHLLGFKGPVAESFEIFIQLGAILAVVVLYRQRFAMLFKFNQARPPGAPARTRFAGLRGLMLLGLTTMPALVIGALVHGMIKQHLFSTSTVAVGLFGGALAILIVEQLKPGARCKSLDDLAWSQALAVGCFQCLAMWPGISRSASTIVGGMLVRMDRTLAAEYSFLAAVPVMLAATSYDLVKSWHVLSISDIPTFFVGFVVSFLVAAAAVKTFIRILQRWTLRPFAFYRIIVAPAIYLLAR